jgi:hypothetical protein
LEAKPNLHYDAGDGSPVLATSNGAMAKC